MKRYIVLFRDLKKPEVIIEAGGIIIDHMNNLSKLLIADLDDQSLNFLLNHQDIDSIEEDEAVESTKDFYASAVSKSSFGYQVPRLKLKDYWDRGIDGTGVKVCIIDSGFAEHDNVSVTEGASLYDQSIPYTTDVTGHGTHVLGIISSKNVGNGGFQGVTPNVETYAVKASGLNDNSTLYNSGILSGFSWAIEKKVDIMNCSFSLPTSMSSSLKSAYQSVLDAGIIIVFSAGNAGNPTLPEGVPDMEGVLTVGRLDHTGNRINSSYGPTLKFSCYGQNILSCSNLNKQGFTKMSGTSMAAPMMTGIVALYKQLFPDLSRTELIQKLIDNAVIPNKDVEFDNEYGYGVVQPPSELYELPIIKRSISSGMYRTGDSECNYYVL